MSKKLKLSISTVVIVAIVAVLVLSAFKKGNSAVDVRIQPVQRKDLVATVSASGQISAHTKVDLSSDVSGKIVKLAVKEGDMVTKGQFLLQINPEQAQASVDQAEAILASSRAQQAQAQANLDQAVKSYERSAAIKKSVPKLVADQDLEQLKTNVAVDQAMLEAAQHNVDQSAASVANAREALGKTTIYAPMSGRVTRLNVELGETAIQGTLNKDAATLLTISDMSNLETRVKVDETDVTRIRVGDSAQVQMDAFPDTTFKGLVTKISNSSVTAAAGTTSSSDQAVDYEVTIQLLNVPAETRPDFTATARIVTATRKNVLAIPIIALTVRDNPTATNADTAINVGLGNVKPSKPLPKRDIEGVYVVGTDNKVTFRPVKVGIAGETDFEVLDGLKAGEKIVAGTYQAIKTLKDSTLVRDSKADAKKPQAAKGK
jgi:HlyD family secretion protein